MLEVTGVSFSYAGHGQDEPPALRDVTLTIEPGMLVALLGHNGSGKSTLAKLMSGILKPETGTVLVDGFDPRDHEQVWEVRRRVGIVFQDPDDQLVTNTLIDDVAFGPENLGLPRAEIEARLAEVIPLLELEPYVSTPLSELSVGQKQRVAIAGVLAMRPRYMILDEPTSMLPPQLARQLIGAVHRFARELQIGVIYITHHMDEVVGFDRLLVIDQGHVVLDGPPRTVFGATERMRSLGLDVPLAMEMGQRLRRRGLDVPSDALSGAELSDALRRLHLAGGRPSAGMRAGAVGAEGAVAPPAAIRAAAEVDGAASLPPGEREPVGIAGRGVPRLAPNPEGGRPLLETRGLAHTHLKGTPFAQVGLAGLTLSVPREAFIACVGPTRSGKSTLVDCLNGLIRPGRDMVYYTGKDVAAPDFDLDHLRTAVGVVFQSPETQILKDVVGKDVAFGPQRKHVSLAESRRLVQECLEAVGLPYEEFRNRYTYALSGGQKRRVAIAGVLATQPEVLVLDEPLAGIDPRGRHEFLALIRALHRERGLTVVYLTSSLEDVIDLADFVYVLDAGRVVVSGEPRTLLRELPVLDEFQVGLSTTSRLALELRALYPDLATDCRDPDELEQALLVCAGRALGAPEPVRQSWPVSEEVAEVRHD